MKKKYKKKSGKIHTALAVATLVVGQNETALRNENETLGLA